MTYDDKRHQRLQLLDDHIGRALRASEASGELRAAPSWGKPLACGDGYDETPPELRLGYKILKDAGYVPAEVEMFKQVAALREQLAGLHDYDGTTGLTRFDEKREAVKPLFMLTIDPKGIKELPPVVAGKPQG